VTYTAAQIAELLPYLTEDEKRTVNRILAVAPVWAPLPGPQTAAYYATADVVGYGGAAGGGKGLGTDTEIATPRGWTTMGDVQPGDKVFDEQGEPCNVLAVSEVHNRPCYRLTFDDDTQVVTDDMHRWLTYDSKELAALTRRDPEWRAARRARRPSNAKGNKSAAFVAAISKANATRVATQPAPTGTVRTTPQICDTVKVRGRANHAVPVTRPLFLPSADLPIPPYVLGVWLGDGSQNSGRVAGIDDEVWHCVEAHGYKVSHHKAKVSHCVLGLQTQLRAAGLLDNKHVPEAYMHASIPQRLALLQGLMDTDGHAAEDGGCEFVNTRKHLSEAVYDLVVSLGVKATIREGLAKLNGRDCGSKWSVRFTTNLPVFRLPRKVARLKQRTRRTQKMRYIVACEPVPSVPTKCIEVDSPSRLFLITRALIPTHNSDLGIGKALTQHQRSAIFRREATQLTGIIDRLAEILGDRDGYNGQERIWRAAGPRKVQLEFGSVPNAGDERKYQGRPKDFLMLDETTNFLEQQVRFLMGWVRTTDPKQRCQVFMPFNPPTNAEGRWVIPFFAPWLDKNHPVPAAPGEERYFVVMDGVEREWYDGTPFTYKGELITPQSRTFIASRVTDNPFLVGTGYMATLQALPEPLRSQMLYGDFTAGMEDSPWQVIPTAWVEEAMRRWEKKVTKPRMDSMGIDVARGGQDNTVIAKRHGDWFDELLAYPATQTPDGPTVAALALANRRDKAPIHIDVIGVGASPYDFLRAAPAQVIGVNFANSASESDKSGTLQFANMRAQCWWKLREALDPANNRAIALPPDSRLLADLCAPTWFPRGKMIYVESREEIIKRIGRSPDYGTAVILALMNTPRLTDIPGTHNAPQREHNPYANLRR
jgi:hypothetical protein